MFDTENNCCSHRGKTLGKQKSLLLDCAVVDSSENAKAYKNKEKLEHHLDRVERMRFMPVMYL
jgi:hypothetical protein